MVSHVQAMTPEVLPKPEIQPGPATDHDFAAGLELEVEPARALMLPQSERLRRSP